MPSRRVGAAGQASSVSWPRISRPTLWRWQWEKKPELVERTTTDADGLARFQRLRDEGQGRGIAVVVRHGGDEALWSQNWWWGRNQRPGETTSGTLLFTDRAIYRPGQKLFWKAVVWQVGWPRVRPLAVPAASRRANPFLLPQLNDINAHGTIVGTVFGLASKDYASLRRVDPVLWTCQFGR